MQVSWPQVVGFLYPKLLGLIVGLVSLTIVVASLQILLINHQNLVFNFSETLGDFDTNTIIADQTISDTRTLIATPHCVIMPANEGLVRCLEPQSGRVKWQTWLTDILQTSPVFSDKHQLLLFSQQHSGLIAIDEKTGQMLWQYKALTSWHWKQQILSDDQDFLVLLNTQNQIAVFEVQSGKLIWQIPTAPETIIEPKTQLFLYDDRLFVADSAALTLTSFNVITGERLWEQRNYTGDLAETVEMAGDLIWYATNFYTWQGVNKDTGVIKAKLTPPPGSVLTNLHNQLVFHDYRSKLFWFDAGTGASLGTTSVSGQIQKVWFEQTLVVKLAAAPFAEKIALIDVSQHQLLWQTETLQVIREVVPVADKKILISSQNGLLTWLEAETGKIIAQSPTQELPLVVKSVPNSQAVWTITTHHGTYSENKELIDLWLFSSPGKLKLRLKDLPLIGATSLVTNERLWLVHQTQKTLISLTTQTQNETPVFWLSHLKQKTQPQSRWQQFFEKINILWQPSRHTLQVEQSLDQTTKGCIATLTITPHSDIIQRHLKKPDFNPWHNAKVIAQLVRQKEILSTTTGYYYLPHVWRTNVLLPNLPQSEDLIVKITFTLDGTELSQTIPITVPAGCATDFLQLSEDGTKLQTKTQIDYWALGLQDAFLDKNQNGDFLDDLAVPKAPIPDDSEKPLSLGVTNYLKTYAQFGFNLFRVSQDNFSFKNWLDFSDQKFHGSLQAGLTTDELLRQLRTQNYAVVFGIFGFAPETESSAIANYLDYCIARFGAWVDVWELSNEAWPNDHWITFVSTYLKNHDPYHHPITTSWDRAENSNIDLVNLHYYRSEPLSELTGEFLSTIHSNQRYQKPIIFGEFGNSETSWDTDSSERFRIKAWLSAWQRTPLIVWNQPTHQLSNVTNANLYLGPIERAAANKLTGWLAKYESMPLQPFTLKTNTPHYCSGLTNASTLVLLYCTNSSGSLKTQLIDPAAVLAAAGVASVTGNWHISWFDPATLQSKGQTSFSTQKFENLVSPGFSADLVSEWQFEP